MSLYLKYYNDKHIKIKIFATHHGKPDQICAPAQAHYAFAHCTIQSQAAPPLLSVALVQTRLKGKRRHLWVEHTKQIHIEL